MKVKNVEPSFRTRECKRTARVLSLFANEERESRWQEERERETKDQALWVPGVKIGSGPSGACR